MALFIVDIIARIDLAPLYARYCKRGGSPYAPEMLLGLLFYAYATGVYSARKIEQGTKDPAAFRFLAGNIAPGYGTIAVFRNTFLPELGVLGSYGRKTVLRIGVEILNASIKYAFAT